MIRNKIRKLWEDYLNGNSSVEGKRNLMKELEKDQSQEDFDLLFKEAWDNAMDIPTDKDHKDVVYSKINEAISFPSRAEGSLKSRRFQSVIKIAAAACVLGVLSTLVFWFIQNQHERLITTINASDSIVVHALPDGSHVWLKKDAKISYPYKFQKNRTLSLEGDAFFDVKKDSLHPFEVSASLVKTTVLGTSFDVNSHSNGTSVVLYSGKVKVQNEKGESWVLRPGHRVDVDSLGSGILSKIIKSSASYWQSGQWDFDQVKFSEVLNFLNRHFKNSKIDVDDSDILLEKVSGSIQNTDNIYDILEMICFSKNWKLEPTNKFQLKIKK